MQLKAACLITGESRGKYYTRGVFRAQCKENAQNKLKVVAVMRLSAAALWPDASLPHLMMMMR